MFLATGQAKMMHFKLPVGLPHNNLNRMCRKSSSALTNFARGDAATTGIRVLLANSTVMTLFLLGLVLLHMQ